MTAIAMYSVATSATPLKPSAPTTTIPSESVGDKSNGSVATNSTVNSRENGVNMKDVGRSGDEKDGNGSNSKSEVSKNESSKGQEKSPREGSSGDKKHSSSSNGESKGGSSSGSPGGTSRTDSNGNQKSGKGDPSSGKDSGSSSTSSSSSKGGSGGGESSGKGGGSNNGKQTKNGSSGSGSAPSGDGGAAAPAAGAPPPPPLLKGTLSYNLELRRHVLRGMWNYENSTEFPPQRFELIRNLGPNEDPKLLPKDGEFHGSFSFAYYHTTSKGKRKERSKVVPESGVNITFTKKDGKDKEYDVKGQGTNQFGVFHIHGTATGSTLADDPTFNVELRKRYASSPSSAPPAATEKKKSKSKSKKRKHQSGANADGGSSTLGAEEQETGPLPPPSQSFPTNVVCLRGKLSRVQSNEIGVTEVVHRIIGMWSSGLDLINADPQNARGLCNRFEYEHKCTLPSEVFPLSGRYTGWFNLSQEDGSRTKVTERDVQLKFRRNNAGHHNVEGRGSNVFGKYNITGTLTQDNILTIFRHFQPRKAKKNSSSSADGSKAGGGSFSLPVKSPVAAPGPLNGTLSSTRPAQPQEPPGPPPLTLDEVEIPNGGADTPLMPIPPPEHGTYSAVSRGVLRINEDGAHTCSGKWAITREHYNNGHTSNFHFGLEAHHALQSAEEMKKDEESTDSTKEKSENSSGAHGLSGLGAMGTTTFPVDSAQYKGSFKMRRGTTKYQSVVDKQIVLKFLKNSQGSYNVHGKGVNSIGTFTLVGTLITSGNGSGHVELYRMYIVAQSPAPSESNHTGGKVLPSTLSNQMSSNLQQNKSSQGAKPSMLSGSLGPGKVMLDSGAPMSDSSQGIAPFGVDRSRPGSAGQSSMTGPPALPRRESSRQTKMPSRLEDDDPESQLARIMEKCTQILKFLRDKDKAAGSFFSEPVDPVAHGIPTYHQVITNPMDLGTIGEKMLAKEVDSPEEFTRLARLVFENAMTFNVDPTHVVHQSARNLLIMFNQKIRDVERMTEQMRKARKPTKAELKEAAREAKRKEKEAKKKAKDEQRERKRKKAEGGSESDAKRTKLDELQTQLSTSEKTLVAITAATGSQDHVSRNEFNLMVQMMQQMQQQMVQMHSLLTTMSVSGASGPGSQASSSGGQRASSAEKSSQSKSSGASEKKKTRKSETPSAKAEKSAPPAPAPAPVPPRTPAPAPAPPPPPPPVEEEKPLTLKEQEELTETINRISADKLPGVIQIIRESASLDADEEEIDLEIDQLDTATQRKLQRFVMKNVKPRRPKKKPQKKAQEPKAKAPTPPPAETPPPAPAPAPAPPSEKKPTPPEKEEPKKSSSSSSTSQSKSKPSTKQDSFFNFGAKGDSDSDTDSDSDSCSSEKNKKGGSKAGGSGGKNSAGSAKADVFSGGFGNPSMQDDDDDDDELPNWGGISQPTAPTEADNDSDEDSDADWGAAKKEAEATKKREEERKAREDRKRADAELAAQQRQRDAEARGEQIRAQRLEEEANEQRLKEQQEKEAEEARKAAREAARAQLGKVVQTVDLDAQRDIMKEYEQSIDFGGSASPSSDFGF